MKKLWGLIGAFSIVLAVADIGTVDAAPILSFDNAQADYSATYQVGDSIALDVWLSGLDASDMGAFDLTMSFDNTVTPYVSTVFSSDLDGSLFFDLQAIPGGSGSTVNLSGASLLFDLSGQADSLKLFTLNLDAASAGVSVLNFDSSLFSDGLGSKLDTQDYAATLTVEKPATSVSEPSSLALIMIAYSVLLLKRYTRKR